jgi:hypothetical protein
MDSIVENVIASIIVTVLSAIAGVCLQAIGLTTPQSIGAAAVLLAFAIVFLVTKKYYPVCTRHITERLLENTLYVSADETDESKLAFKKKLVERVLLENAGIALNQNTSVKEYLSQQACEAQIQEASRTARKVKILTIRGEKYFVGSKSLLHHLCSSKKTSTKFLVLSPDAPHLTSDLAAKLDHESIEEIKEKMCNALQILLFHARRNKNFEVKCYSEVPNFKVLLFDDVMFVSAFVAAKNDHNAKMFQITREGEPLFTGLERHFDDLWQHSTFPR